MDRESQRPRRNLSGFPGSSKEAEARSGLRAEVRHIVVLGAGTTGKQIAVQCAGHGYDVILHDIDSSALSAAKEQVAEILDWLSTRGYIRGGESVSILERLKVE